MSSSPTTKPKKELTKEMFQAGTHFGFGRARQHPSAIPFIFGFKNRTAIIDLEKSQVQLETAKEFVKSVAAAGKKILFVGTKAEASQATVRAAEELNMPYVSLRWLGGTFTNFPQMKKRIERMVELREEKEKGTLVRYTKREQARLLKELSDLERYFASISSLKEFPGAIIVIDSRKEAIAVTEAAKVGVPVISLSGTDCDLSKVAYPVVGNDAQVASIKFFLEHIKTAYQSGIIVASATTNNDNDLPN